MATKQEIDKKKQIACDLYMNGRTLKEIAESINVSDNTLTRWAKLGNWKTRKTASGVTRKELVIKNLEVINVLLENIKNMQDAKELGRTVDQICKLSASIEKLDKSTNVVTVIEIFTSLNKWLRQRMEFDTNITPELLQKFDYYQDLYINEQLKEESK